MDTHIYFDKKDDPDLNEAEADLARYIPTGTVDFTPVVLEPNQGSDL